MTIVTVNNLNRIFNKTVVDIMNKGYIISQFTNDGSYSYSNTEGHLDMIKPNDKSHIIRVWIVTGIEDTDHRVYHHVDTIAIRVSKYTRKNGFDGRCCSQTLWPDRGDVLSERKFYQISERKFYQICDRSEHKGRRVYTDNLDDAMKILNMRWDRYCSRDSNDNKNNYYHSIEISKLPASFIDNIMHRINSIRGFKRAMASCITKVIVGKDHCGKMSADVHYSQNGKNGIIKLR